MSVVSRMLNDLERRGATPPVALPTAVVQEHLASSERSDLPANHYLLRGVLLSASLLVGVVGVYQVDMPAAKSSHVQHAAPTKPFSARQAVANAFQMDWALSLGLVKPAPVKVSLSPYEDLTRDPVDASEHHDGEPAPDAAVTPVVSNFAMIDPPAAGRVQSSANQAVEVYRRALVLAEQGKDSSALDAAMQALKLDAQHLPARRLAAELALGQNKVDQANVLIDEGLKLDPRDSELLFLHARRLTVAGANDQALLVLQSMDHLSSEGQGLKAGLLARSGQYAQAAMAYEVALKTRPDNSTWWLGLGVALNAQGQQAMARDAFLHARKLGQLSPDVLAWVDQQL